MSDERLREMERRWKETGSVENEALYLLERVRVGDLEKEKLELAAYCGHDGARLTLGRTAPASPTTIYSWTRGLHRFGPTHLGQGLVLVAVGAVPNPDSELQRRRRSAASAWVLCPCGPHARACTTLAEISTPMPLDEAEAARSWLMFQGACIPAISMTARSLNLLADLCETLTFHVAVLAGDAIEVLRDAKRILARTALSLLSSQG